MKTNKNTKSTNLHTRPVPAHTDMSHDQIAADSTRVQWRTPRSFSASRAFTSVNEAYQS